MNCYTRTIQLMRFTLSMTLFSLAGVSAQVTYVSGVAFTVRDLDHEVKFFQDVLQFNMVGEFNMDAKTSAELFGIEAAQTRVAVLQLGEERLQLVKFEGEENQEIPVDSHSNDLWFQHIAIVVSDMDRAYEVIRENDLQFISSGPQTLPDYLPNASGITAFYFQDPEGHVLELIQFPQDKGKAKWKKPSDKLFLGIDHSAIGIDRTSRSLPFYTGLLGLKVGGKSENYGPEQEHLNQVFGAHLQITGLHADHGVGVELLDYLAPQGGKPYPSESKPTDLWHWHYMLESRNLEYIYDKLIAQDYTVVSSGIVDVAIPGIGISGKALLARDPDGHALLLYQN